MHFSDSSRGRPFAKDPAVVSFQGRYLLYYSLPPFDDGRENDGWRIGIAESQNLDDWQAVAELSVTQPCEHKGFCAPGAIVLNNKLHLFYQTYGNAARDAICHAYSKDGISFTRNPENPIFRPTGNWNCGRAIDADVIVKDDKLLLYFATRDPEFKVQMLGLAEAPLESDFGVNSWTQISKAPILKPELAWEQECIEAPALAQHEGRFYMFYGGAYNCKPQQIGVAVSDDGLNWQRCFDKPVLTHGTADSWNAHESGHPFLFTDTDGTMHLFYQGTNTLGKTWYLSRATVSWQEGLPKVHTD